MQAIFVINLLTQSDSNLNTSRKADSNTDCHVCLTTAFMCLLASPILPGTLIWIFGDLQSNRLFCDPILGGDPVVYQHLCSALKSSGHSYDWLSTKLWVGIFWKSEACRWQLLRWSFVTVCKAHQYPCVSRCSSSFRRRSSSCCVVSFDMLYLSFDQLCCFFKFL